MNDFSVQKFINNKSLDWKNATIIFKSINISNIDSAIPIFNNVLQKMLRNDLKYFMITL